MTIKAGSPEAHQRALKAAATRKRNIREGVTVSGGRAPKQPKSRKPAISKMSVREIEDELSVGYHVARAYGDSPRRTQLQAELKKRQHAKFAKEEKERAKKQRHEEAERKLRVRGQSSRAKAPVRRALAEAEKARKHMFTVTDMRQRGKATWDDVRDAETAWRHASDLFTEAYRAYESKYHTTYVN